MEKHKNGRFVGNKVVRHKNKNCDRGREEGGLERGDSMADNKGR